MGGTNDSRGNQSIMMHLQLITGWAHEAEALEPLAVKLRAHYHVQCTDAATILQRRKVPACDVVLGWSIGGMLAIHYASSSCKAFVLAASTACFCSTGAYTAGVKPAALKRMRRQLQQDAQATVQSFYMNAYSPGKPGSAPTALQESALDEGLAYLQERDLRKAFIQTTRPILLIHGRNDAIIPWQASEWIYENTLDSRLCLLEKSGHAFPVQEPDITAREVDRFIREL